MPAYHYSLDAHAVTIMGVPVTEYPEGGGLDIEFVDDDWDVKQGHHGAVVRFKKVNNVAEATLTLLQGSPTVAALMAAANADKRTGLGAGLFDVSDTNGTSHATAARSWCKKIPAMGVKTEAGEVEFTFQLANPEINHGFNRLV